MSRDAAADDRDLADTGSGRAQRRLSARSRRCAEGDRRRRARIQSASAARRAAAAGGNARVDASKGSPQRCGGRVAPHCGGLVTRIRVAILPLALTLGYALLLAFFFAHAEIEIEGAGGWAANLPTWRIERHWLLDLFWGG